MRCGIAIFSVCALIDRCLTLVQMAEVYKNRQSALQECQTTFLVTMVSIISSILFIFLQSFFIFKYANLIINYGKNASVIGIMHIVSTNFCITVRTIIHETVSEIQKYNHELMEKTQGHVVHKRSSFYSSNEERSLVNNNLTNSYMPEVGCINIKHLESDVVLYVHDAQENLDSYFFPCIIEYSLMSMTVFFILWDSIQDRFIEYRSKSKSLGEDSRRNNDQHHRLDIREANTFTVDCGKSTTGLFFGILVLLITIITLITYFIYHDHDQLMVIQLSEYIELFLLSISLMTVIAIICKLKYHKFESSLDSSLDYNSLLTMIGLAGIYLYGFYSIIAIVNNHKMTQLENLFLTIHILSIVESTFQTILIINALKMYTSKEANKNNKPARSLIILLILIDVSLWLVETLCVKKYDMNEMQLEYFDIVFWSIVSSISSPLAIFFRFHASVCLSDVWKTLYE